MNKKKYINDVCKNALFVEDKNKKGSFINNGCKNLREDGSSRCSDCSYKYHIKKNEK